MRGIVYFPYINVPPSAWLTSAILYWDDVATIVPNHWRHDRSRFEPATLELIESGLVREVYPDQAHSTTLERFSRWLANLDQATIAERRAGFEGRNWTMLHASKIFTNVECLRFAASLGLADADALMRFEEWVPVERQTAAEFMSLLALALCHPQSDLMNTRPGEPETWVPGTDNPASLTSMLAGLDPVPDESQHAEREVQLLVEYERRTSEIRSVVLERILPIPSTPVPTDELTRFKNQRGPQLAAFRLELERRIHEIAREDDPVLQLGARNRLVQELSEQRSEVEKYLSEWGIRWFARSSVVSLMRVIPLLSTAVEGLQESAERALTVETEPLSYLAFADVELDLRRRYRAEQGESLESLALR